MSCPKRLIEVDPSHPAHLGPRPRPEGATVISRRSTSGGRSNVLTRCLVGEGIGKDERFWSLAQALSELYPSHMDEKRWVDGVLARKKGLGF